ncbi:MAG: YajD family HNH nuclease [Methylococcales bacterium]|nr:YajD family HNH nuclease [Methylococcales bacterium]
MKQTSLDKSRANKVIAEAQRAKTERERGYREKALKMYPWICGRCQREFDHSNVRELTVHHRNHNHDDNPEDGSNWELLCLYCHDNEHARYENAALTQHSDRNASPEKPGAFKPFADLASLLKQKQS